VSWYLILGQVSHLLLVVLLIILVRYSHMKTAKLIDKLAGSFHHNKDLGDALVEIHIKRILERIIASTAYYTEDEVRLLKSAILGRMVESNARIHFGHHKKIGGIYIDSINIRAVGLVSATNLIIALMRESQVFTDSEIEEENQRLLALAYYSTNYQP
jgi:hypothetical protein